MARSPGFVGPSNKGLSKFVDGERCINRIPCRADAGKPRSPDWFESVPGYRPFCGLSAGPVRGIFSQDGRCFAVGGGVFSEVLPTHTSVPRGLVAVDGNPATISSSGSQSFQLFITSGGLGYVYDLTTNALTQITDPGFPDPVTTGAYFNNRFVALLGGSNQFNFSDLVDATTWPALNVCQVSKTSDNVVAMIADHDELWLFGSKHSQPWYADPSGAGSNIFAPILGGLMEMGAWAPYACARLDNTTLWVGANEHGNGVVYRADGYSPRIISTRAIDLMLQQLPRIDNALAWTYQQNGHSYYVLNLPNAETTPVYDVSTGLWHERGLWDDDLILYTPDVGRCHAFAFGKHLVGDRKTNTIYEMSPEFYTYQVVLS